MNKILGKAISETVTALRAAGMFVFDHPQRKLAVYENPDGQVVILSCDEGRWQPCLVEIDEVDRVIEMLVTAKAQAARVAEQNDEALQQAGQAGETR